MASREEEEGKYCKENRINKSKEVNNPTTLPGIDKYLTWTVVERGVHPEVNLIKCEFMETESIMFQSLGFINQRNFKRF